MEKMPLREKLIRKATSAIPFLKPSWHYVPNNGPWTDAPDALNQLKKRVDKGVIPEVQSPLIQKWIESGYCVIKNAIPQAEVDTLSKLVDEIILGDQFLDDLKGVHLLGLRYNKDEELSSPLYDEYFHYDKEKKQAAAKLSSWRIHALHH